MRALGDLMLACLLLAITSLLMLIVALAIKLESPGPVTGARGMHRRRSSFQKLKFQTASVKRPPDRGTDPSARCLVPTFDGLDLG